MKIGIVGSEGHMGRYVAEAALAAGHEVVGLDAGIGMEVEKPLAAEKVDAIIDFSHPSNLERIVNKAKADGVPAIIATTGMSEAQEATISELARLVPVVYTSNFSYGVTVLKKIVQYATGFLKDDFDIEVVEAHHNRKIDAPSGTAKMLVKAINPDGEFAEVEGRSGSCKRGHEIGIHAIRGGNIVGEHTVIYAGADEVIEIKHSAGSRKIFANGSVKAAEFAAGVTAGLYDMEDVILG